MKKPSKKPAKMKTPLKAKKRGKAFVAPEMKRVLYDEEGEKDLLIVERKEKGKGLSFSPVVYRDPKTGKLVRRL